MKLEFQNLSSPHVRSSFLAAYEGFPEVHAHRLAVRQQPMRVTTMQAQPILNFNFFRRGRRDYIIRLSDNIHLQRKIRVHELPAEVLTGWFAHELGHIIDYLPRTATGLLKFGLGYLMHPNFRIGAERRADIYAIAHGYADAVIATKKYILERSSLPNHYKNRIERYYMSADEVMLMERQMEEERLRMDKLF